MLLASEKFVTNDSWPATCTIVPSEFSICVGERSVCTEEVLDGMTDDVEMIVGDDFGGLELACTFSNESSPGATKEIQNTHKIRTY